MSESAVTRIAEIEALISGFLRDELLPDGSIPGPEESLFASGLVDSIAIVRLVAHVERELDVTVPAPDLVPDNFRTVRVLASYLAGLKTT